MATQPLTMTETPPLERVYLEHHSRVFRAAYRVTGSASDAEDVTQTVFLRLARLGEAGVMDNPASYLYRAGVNAAVDLLRQRQSTAAVPFEDLGPGGPVQNGAALHELADLRRALREALGRLHPRAAEMFALRYFEGHDNGQIARLLGTSAAVVAVTLHRTRSRLKRDLVRFAAAGRR